MKHPDCERDPAECRITLSRHAATLPWFERVFNGYGAMVNKDPTIHYCRKSCDTCGRVWQEQFRQDEAVSIEDLTPKIR